MNEDKKHGIIIDNVMQYDFNLLIVPDAGSEDIKQCKELKEKYDVDILILDHHKFKADNPYAVLINCQDKQYPNNTLSGAGVVYKFIKEYDKKYRYDFADKYLDLVAIGIIGDSMDLRNYETRQLVLKGLKNIQNDFVKEIIKKQQKNEFDEVNIDFVGWKISPLLNAVARCGTDEEKNELINAILGKEGYKEYQPRRKNKNDTKPEPIIQTLQESMVRGTTNIKARQDRLVKKGMELLIEKINKKHLDNNKVIIVDGTEEIEKIFTGLVANKLTNIYKRPIIILRKMSKKNKEGKTVFGGSFRNYKLSPIISFFDVLVKTNLFYDVGGHDNAGGYEILEDDIPKAIKKLNEMLSDMIIEDTYLVDYEIPVGRLKERHVTQVGQWKNMWGNTLNEPLFAVTDITLKIEDIKLLGEKRNFIKFDKSIGQNKISFVKMFANEDTYNMMIMKNKKGLSKQKSNKVKIDVIGKFTINHWNDNEYPQVEIVDFNSSPCKDFKF